MADRSSRPRISPRQTDGALAERIAGLGRRRLTGKHIAMETGVSPTTVSRVLKCAGLSRMKDFAPIEPVVRYSIPNQVAAAFNGDADHYYESGLRRRLLKSTASTVGSFRRWCSVLFNTEPSPPPSSRPITTCAVTGVKLLNGG